MGKDKYAEDGGAPKNFSVNFPVLGKHFNAAFQMRMAISQMRSKQKTTQAECDRLRKLMELAKPHTLEEMMPKLPKLEVAPQKTQIAVKTKAPATVQLPKETETDPMEVDDNVKPGDSGAEDANDSGKPVKIEVKHASPAESAEPDEEEPEASASTVKGPALPTPLPTSQHEAVADKPVKEEAPTGGSEPKIYGLISKAQLREHKRPRKERRTQVDADEALMKEVSRLLFALAKLNHLSFPSAASVCWELFQKCLLPRYKQT